MTGEEKHWNNNCWGMSTCVDLHECTPHLIRDAAHIERFVIELCERIKVKRFGPTTIVHFGEDDRVAGFSMTQLIETSLISGHFVNLTNDVFLDVFSCKEYDPAVVEMFAKESFGALYSELTVVPRLGKV